MSIKDSLVVFLEGARANFKTHGHLVPVFAAVLDCKPQIMGLVWDKPAEKEIFAKNIQQWISENRLTEYIMVVEAWTAKADDLAKVSQHLQTHGSLESWSNRGEIVSVFYCSPTEEIECTADIDRGIIGLPCLGDWQRTDRKVKFALANFSTRFQGLFLKGKFAQN